MYEVKESFNKNILKDLWNLIKNFIIPFLITLVILTIVYFIVSLGSVSFVTLLVIGTIVVKKVLDDLNPKGK